jgi:excisionase family DNA binding protein
VLYGRKQRRLSGGDRRDAFSFRGLLRSCTLRYILARMTKPIFDTAPIASVTPRLLSKKDAAIYLGCTFWAIRDLVWVGELKAIRIGKRDCIDRVDLDAWIEKRKKAG